jgi:hypothetical protein
MFFLLHSTFTATDATVTGPPAIEFAHVSLLRPAIEWSDLIRMDANHEAINDIGLFHEAARLFQRLRGNSARSAQPSAIGSERWNHRVVNIANFFAMLFGDVA